MKNLIIILCIAVLLASCKKDPVGFVPKGVWRAIYKTDLGYGKGTYISDITFTGADNIEVRGRFIYDNSNVEYLAPVSQGTFVNDYNGIAFRTRGQDFYWLREGRYYAPTPSTYDWQNRGCIKGIQANGKGEITYWKN